MTHDPAWDLVLAASALAEGLEREGRVAWFAPGAEGRLDATSTADAAVLEWQPGQGWISHLEPSDPRCAHVDLYLPLCSATSVRPITIGHLGQSLDGFIATHSGDSQFVTGEANIVHLHRMRALSDAVVVGAGTVAADNPLLTTRLVTGSNPLRVIFDPARRLAPTYRIFSDVSAPTVYVCARSLVRPGETTVGTASLIGFDDTPGQEVTQVLALLRSRGCSRVFVEGGGVTVSAFLEANLLDRLQMAIAPLLIGDGRPAIRLAPHANLRDCRRPAYRVFRMGGDILFDCALTPGGEPADARPALSPLITRVI